MQPARWETQTLQKFFKSIKDTLHPLLTVGLPIETWRCFKATAVMASRFWASWSRWRSKWKRPSLFLSSSGDIRASSSRVVVSAETLGGAEAASSWLDSDRLICTAGMKSFRTASSSLSSSPDSAHSKMVQTSAAAESLPFQPRSFIMSTSLTRTMNLGFRIDQLYCLDEECFTELFVKYLPVCPDFVHHDVLHEAVFTFFS